MMWFVELNIKNQGAVHRRAQSASSACRDAQLSLAAVSGPSCDSWPGPNKGSQAAADIARRTDEANARSDGSLVNRRLRRAWLVQLIGLWDDGG